MKESSMGSARLLPHCIPMLTLSTFDTVNLHGFCNFFLDFEQAENIKFTLEQMMVFFARLVGKFEVADDITPIKIENFD